RVEVLVAGDDEVVQSLIKWLKIGPKYAKVSTIEVIDFPVDYLQGSQQGYFDVLPTR
ncbi:MAG: acylphosphatase, partial [Gammaproteobacteria bacterium]|nr:acylphosphatase [Gammaproteobacteria bacterium]